MLTKHPFIKTLLNLRGNTRGCVYTEPLWGIPFNLYAPYVSVYMLAFGLSDSQIGLITTIGLTFQVMWTILSGAITDKLGRKRTTLIFDIISWSIPCLIWAAAQNFTYFLVAAIVNSVWRVTHNSWTCLLVEDTDPKILVDVYSWVHIAGLLSAFVSPLTGLLIAQFSLVPTMRGLYLLAFVMMTAKFFANNALATETEQGKIRLQETKRQTIFDILGGYSGVLQEILHSPALLSVAGLMIILSISLMVQRTFWSILVTEKLLIPPEHLAIYPFVRSVTMLLFYFLIMPRVRDTQPYKPMALGFLGLIVSQVILIAVPVKSYWLLGVATVLEACSYPTANVLVQKLVVVTVDAKERARIMAILNMIMLLFTSPFGWISGKMSEIDRILPFVLMLILFVLGGVLIWASRRLEVTHPPLDKVEQTNQA